VDYYYFFRDIDSNILNLAQITARFYIFDADLQQRKRAAKTLLTISGSESIKRNYRRSIVATIVCSICGKSGHSSERCWNTYSHLKRTTCLQQNRQTQSRGSLFRSQNSSNRSEPRKILALAIADIKRFDESLKIKTANCSCKISNSLSNNVQVDLSLQSQTGIRISKNREKKESYKKNSSNRSERNKDVISDNFCQLCSLNFGCYQSVKITDKKIRNLYFRLLLQKKLQKLREQRHNYICKLRNKNKTDFLDTSLGHLLQYIWEEQINAGLSSSNIIMLISKNNFTIKQDK